MRGIGPQVFEGFRLKGFEEEEGGRGRGGGMRERGCGSDLGSQLFDCGLNRGEVRRTASSDSKH